MAVDSVHTIETNQKLVVSPPTSTPFIVNIEEETSQRRDDKLNASDVGKQHPQINKQSNKFTSSERIVTNMSQSTSDTEMESATTTTQHSSRIEVTQISGILVSAGASRFESSDGDKSAILSRVVRSAARKQSVLNKKQWEHNRKKFCKQFNKGTSLRYS